MGAPPDGPSSDGAGLLASAVHELRTPLVVMTGFADLLDRSLDRATPDELRTMVATIRRNGARLSELVDELLLVARLDGYIAPFRFVDTEALPILTAAADVAHAYSVPVRVICPPKLAAHTDPARLEQALGALIENSCRYGQGPIEIRALRCGRRVAVAVNDSGAGIPPEHVDGLFDQYSRASTGTRGSNGLGLHTARRIARCLHGDLTYYTDPRGWAFVVTVPTARAEDPADTDDEPDAATRIGRFGIDSGSWGVPSGS